MVPYVDVVFAMTVMRALLFVLCVCMLRESKGRMCFRCLMFSLSGLVSGYFHCLLDLSCCE